MSYLIIWEGLLYKRDKSVCINQKWQSKKYFTNLYIGK